MTTSYQLAEISTHEDRVYVVMARAGAPSTPSISQKKGGYAFAGMTGQRRAGMAA
jgi:hypothetical protein